MNPHWSIVHFRSRSSNQSNQSNLVYSFCQLSVVSFNSFGTFNNSASINCLQPSPYANCLSAANLQHQQANPHTNQAARLPYRPVASSHRINSLPAANLRHQQANFHTNQAARLPYRLVASITFRRLACVIIWPVCTFRSASPNQVNHVRRSDRQISWRTAPSAHLWSSLVGEICFILDWLQRNEFSKDCTSQISKTSWLSETARCMGGEMIDNDRTGLHRALLDVMAEKRTICFRQSTFCYCCFRWYRTTFSIGRIWRLLWWRGVSNSIFRIRIGQVWLRNAATTRIICTANSRDIDATAPRSISIFHRGRSIKRARSSFMKVTNGPEDISLHSANDLASAKIICYTNSTGNDFVSAEVIAASNGRDQSTYDQSADRSSPTDTPPPPPYKSIESDQARPPIHVKSNVDRVRRNFIIFSIFKWPEMIKLNSIISTFDRTRRLHRLHHHHSLRRPPNGRTNGLIHPRSSTSINMPPYLRPLQAPNGLDGRSETSYRHVRWSMKMRSYNTEISENFGGFLGGYLRAFLEGFSRPYRASYVSGLVIRFDDHTIIRSDHHFSTFIWGEGIFFDFSELLQCWYKSGLTRTTENSVS